MSLIHLSLVSPPQKGKAVERLQRKLGIVDDGIYGPVTARAVKHRKHRMGFPRKALHTGASVFFQEILYGRRKRPPAYVARAARRRSLRRRRDADDVVRSRAVGFLIDRVGRTERDNRAPWLDKWQLANGHGRFQPGEPGWPWCGIACWAAYTYGAKRKARGEWRSVRWIYENARAHTNGLRIVPLSQARPGDLAILFSPDTHVGMVRSAYRGGQLSTVEGNTSSGRAGSQADGDGIWKRERDRSDVVAIVRVEL